LEAEIGSTSSGARECGGPPVGVCTVRSLSKGGSREGDLLLSPTYLYLDPIACAHVLTIVGGQRYNTLIHLADKIEI
jgi:hypothetical protein